MIISQSDLKECVAHCQSKGIVAIDTEFVWERTFYPNLGLIQVASDEKCFLIDPLAFDDLSALGELISDPEVMIIFHDALQDLQILNIATKALPTNVFDTRSASGFAGGNGTISLAKLHLELLDIDLPKTESRTDWIKRPLTDKQVEYAKDDVIYMVKMCQLLIERMKANETYAWFNEEMQALEDPKNYDDSNSASVQFAKAMGGGRFSPQQLEALKQLVFWREGQAKLKNKPRNFIIRIEVLVDIANLMPETIQELKDLKGVPRYHAEKILELVKIGLEAEASNCPTPFKSPLDRKALKKHADYILNYSRSHAEEVHIDSACVTSRKEVSSFVNSYFINDKQVQPCRLNRGWRQKFFQDLSPMVVED